VGRFRSVPESRPCGPDALSVASDVFVPAVLAGIEATDSRTAAVVAAALPPATGARMGSDPTPLLPH